MKIWIVATDAAVFASPDWKAWLKPFEKSHHHLSQKSSSFFGLSLLSELWKNRRTERFPNGILVLETPLFAPTCWLAAKMGAPLVFVSHPSHFSSVEATEKLLEKAARRAGSVRGPDGAKIHPEDFTTLKTVGLEPVAVREVSIDSLQFAISPDFEAVTSQFLENRRMADSPHAKLLRLYLEKGKDALFEACQNTDYYRFFESFNHVGEKTDLSRMKKVPVRFEPDDIRTKILHFIQVFESLKKNGYQTGRFDNRWIAVLERPLVQTRFGWKTASPPGTYEVFLGHHRAAALSVLGAKKIRVLVLKDVRPS